MILTMQLPGQGGLDGGEDEGNWSFAGNSRCPLHILPVLEEVPSICGHTHNYIRDDSRCKVKFKTARLRGVTKLHVTSAVRGTSVRA